MGLKRKPLPPKTPWVKSPLSYMSDAGWNQILALYASLKLDAPKSLDQTYIVETTWDHPTSTEFL